MSNDTKREAFEAFIRLNDLMGEHIPESAQTESASADWQKVYDALSADALNPSAGYKKAAEIGKVVGVLVENEAGGMAAVHDLGRVTWLDDCVARPSTKAADSIAGSNEIVRGDVALLGDVTDEDGTTFHKALLVQFTTDDKLQEAIRSGHCRFTVFGSEG